MEFEEILKNNILNKDTHKKCEHELDEIKIIYKRCKCCGKFVVCPDEEFVAKKGVMGRSPF